MRRHDNTALKSERVTRSVSAVQWLHGRFVAWQFVQVLNFGQTTLRLQKLFFVAHLSGSVVSSCNCHCHCTRNDKVLNRSDRVTHLSVCVLRVVVGRRILPFY